MKNKKGAIIVLTGPSGAGKTTLCDALFKSFTNLRFSVSCTTRPAREDEIDGVHYQFLSKEQFQQGIARGDFVEYAEVHGNFYGTLKTELQTGIDVGWFTLLDIDVQGQMNIKKLYGDYVLSIFVTTPSYKDLERRLLMRGTEDVNSLQERLQSAALEMKQIPLFDYLIINDDKERASNEIVSVVRAFLCTIPRYDVQGFINNWAQH
ncbi:MAG: guanylate kinase [Helicobacter sp.]|nr:guanylate kinase [Helicobacter sp.]